MRLQIRAITPCISESPGSLYDGAALEYVNHVARRRTLPALSCRMHEQGDFALTILWAREHFFDELPIRYFFFRNVVLDF